MTTGQLTWTDQDSSPKKIPLTIIDDDQAEGEESFTLRLNQPTGEASLGTPATLTVTIVDDETTQPQNPGVLQFLTMHYAASESDAKPVITVTRTNGSEGQVTVQYIVTNDSTARLNDDYTDGTGTLTWNNGDDEPKRIQLTLIDDPNVEDLETLNFTLLNPTKGATLGEHYHAILTITDNDVTEAGPGTVQFAQADYQAHEEEGSLKTITITRTGGNQGQVSVQYQVMADSTATAESDYLLGDTHLLTWPDGDSEAKIIPITIVDDPQIEVTETVQFQLLNQTGSVTLGDLSQALLTILDNDSTSENNPQPGEEQPVNSTPVGENNVQSGEDQAVNSISNGSTTPNLADEFGQPITAMDSNGTDTISTTPSILQFFTDIYYLNEGIGPVSTFTVTRTGGRQGVVSVEYTTTTVGTADIGLDYVGGSGLLTWADGDDTPKAIEIKIIDDSQSEGAETIQLQLENPTGYAQLGSDDSAILIIADNDSSPESDLTIPSDTAILQFESALHWVQEEDGQIKLKITRTGSSQGEVAVNYLETLHSNATPGEDYLNGSGSLVWADGDNQSQTITLELIDDDLPETEFIHLVLVEPLGQAVLGKQNETLIIVQDQDRPVSLKVTAETSNLTTIQLAKPVETITESQSEILIPVIRTGTQGPATVDYETMAGNATVDEDYLSRQGRLVWQDGEEGIVALTIPIIVDSQPEPDESFTLRLHWDWKVVR